MTKSETNLFYPHRNIKDYEPKFMIRVTDNGNENISDNFKILVTDFVTNFESPMPSCHQHAYSPKFIQYYTVGK